MFMDALGMVMWSYRSAAVALLLIAIMLLFFGAVYLRLGQKTPGNRLIAGGLLCLVGSVSFFLVG